MRFDSTFLFLFRITKPFIFYQVAGGKVLSPPLTKPELLSSSPLTPTSTTSTRICSPSLSGTTSAPSNGTVSKTSTSQSWSQVPATSNALSSPTPSSSKPTISGVASLREQFNAFEYSTSTPRVKTSSETKSSVSSVPTDTSIPVPSTSIKETPLVPKTTAVKSEEASKLVETIPKFYFPSGHTTSTIEALINKQLRQAKEELFLPKHDRLYLEDCGRLAQVLLQKSIVFFGTQSNLSF